MSNLNGRGPFGRGPMTGRGMGRCRGGNFGFGARNRYTKEDKLSALEEERKILEEEIEEVKKEKGELEKRD